MNDTQRRTCERTPTEVIYIENHWRHLQPHVREAIMTLVDGALTAGLVERNVRNEAGGLSAQKVDFLSKKSDTDNSGQSGRTLR